MIDNNHIEDKRKDYRQQVLNQGKKEFTLQKMQEYSFWPNHLPTPYERQENESKEDYEARKALLQEYDSLADKLSKLFEEKDEITKTLHRLRRQYDNTWNYEKIHQDVAQAIMKESIARRAARKAQREAEKKARTKAWLEKKANEIVFIGKGYSSALSHKEMNKEKLLLAGLPLIETDRELATFLNLDYEILRFLTYHRDVAYVDHYYRYEIPKKKGGVRQIAAPKPVLKWVQRKILTDILEKLPVSKEAHGFIKGKSVISSAQAHSLSPTLLINMDLENFFPTITFERVRGLFRSFGYSGHIASLLAMLCTYCERMALEVNGKACYVKTSDRILPQGSPASPMITNLICKHLDSRLHGIAKAYGFTYSRYADDMSFSYTNELNTCRIGQFLGCVTSVIKEEGFIINSEKTRFLYEHNRQCMTGIVLNNNTLGVPKKWVKVLRATLHRASLLKASGQELPLSLRQEIKGKLCWLNSVNPERYEKIIKEGLKFINS